MQESRRQAKPPVGIVFDCDMGNDVADVLALAMLYGFAFFSHQVGGFLGGWLGGVFYEWYGNYDLVWYGSIALGVASAAINLPIIEKAAPARIAPQPA